MAIDRGRSTRSICIICGDREGTVRTVDGLVCGTCMPRDLLPGASGLRRHNIVMFQRTNPGWASCASVSAPTGPTVGADRSMAITGRDSVVLADELNAQIPTAESIDIVVSFIKSSGLNLIIDALREFARTRRVRVITTAYMGATEYAALHELLALRNAEVRMELDAESTRLHAKAFIFHRPDGGGTAYVGSANISRSALTSGEEWVVKLREADVPSVIRDLEDSYEHLWTSRTVRAISESDRAEVEAALECRGNRE